MVNDKSFDIIGAFNTIITNKILIKSCTEFLEYVFYIKNQPEFETLLWFRGVSEEDHSPVPRIHRIEREYSPGFEKFLVTQFVLKARRYNYSLQSQYEWIQLMQHYGLPTRLLDWTEGALIGLYFAVRNEKCEIPSVWIINPLELNKIVIEKNIICVTDKIVPDNDDLILDDYLNYEELPSLPIAISPSNIDQRIQVQKSVFTLHGGNYNDILNPKIAEKMLFYKLKIESQCANRVRKQLHLLGIDESTLFPDLEGIARDLEFVHDLNKSTWHLKYEKM